VFCAGADLKERAQFPDEPGFRWRQARSVRECLYAVTECRKPVIAALNGPALGGGLALAAACDILIAAEEATVGLPEVTVGLLGGARHAKRLFGHSTLRRMALTGYRLDARELLARRVVEAVVPRDRLLDEARAIADPMGGLDLLALTRAKATLNAIESMTLRDGYRHEQEETVRLRESKRPAPDET
jgi:enoyl-CoA hydratase/carnithine racemase